MRSNGKLPNSTCQMCGKNFFALACEIKRGGGKYCSRECYNQSRFGIGNHRYISDKGWINCKNCDKKFRVYPSRVGSGKSKIYCSGKCREFVIGRKDITCQECGKSFSVIPSRLNRTDAKTLFCNLNCLARHQSHTSQTSNGIRRGTTRGGKRSDLNASYFRSSWEANYARYLNHLLGSGFISRWEYEPDTFEFPSVIEGVKFYTPDFKVFNFDGSYEYHEVKGWMDNKSQNRLAQTAKFYPQEKIVLINKPVYTKLSKNFKNLIPNWEE